MNESHAHSHRSTYLKGEFKNIAAYSELYLGAFEAIYHCMKSNVKTIVPHCSVAEAKRLMSFYDIDQLPVLNEKGVVLGLVTRKGIEVKLARRKKYKEMDADEFEIQILVEEVMYKEFTHTSPEKLIIDVIDQLIFEGSQCVIIRDNDMTFQGLASRSDITEYLYLNDRDFFLT